MKTTPSCFNSLYNVLSSNLQPGDFIVGECAVSLTEYIVHLNEPRLIAKYNDGCEETLEDAQSSFHIVINGCIFYDIQWLDYEPDMGMQVELFVEANAAIERYSWKDDVCGDDHY